MSSSRLTKRLSSTIGFHIAAGYSLLVFVSFLLLLGIAYSFLTATLTRTDHEQVAVELQSLRENYLAGGYAVFEKAVIDNDRFRKNNPFFTRIRYKDEPARIFFPQYWEEFDLRPLDAGLVPMSDGWIHLPSQDDRYELEILGTEDLVDFHFQIGISTQDREAILDRLQDTFLFVSIPLLLFCLAGGALLAQRSLRPIRQLIQTVESIHGGAWEARAPRTGRGDELDDLGRLFNELIEKINGLIRGMKNTLDNVAHDLRTPMTHFRNQAEEALRKDTDPDGCRCALQVCVEESDHVLSMLNMLMDISEAETGTLYLNRRVVDFSALVENVAEMYRFVAEEKDISLECTIEPLLHLTVDSERMSQALANLLDNAVKYTQASGTIQLRLEVVDSGVSIEVADNGAGLDVVDLDKIWDRLYRGRHESRGMGLGLSLVKAITLAHGGEVKAHNRPEGGALFIMNLPFSVIS
jgi:signal transduction histidine kinase